MSLGVEEYVEKFELLQQLREDGRLTTEVESELEDELTELWQSLSVEECREIERRYPALKVAV